MIQLEDVSLSFATTDVLNGVSLTVEPGEFVALVGPNGAGKTTLLRTINGVLTPDSGTVRLDGDAIDSLSSKSVSRRVATVPQDTHIGFTFTAEQLVEMGRTPHRSRLDWSDDLHPVEQAMKRTETLALRDRSADELSGGERQRVLLARALAQETNALVLDEPTASLDINHQVQVLSLVKALVSEGKTAVAAIHDLDLAARFCDRLLLLSDGEIQTQGRPEQVLSHRSLSSAFNTETTTSTDQVTGTPRITALTERPTHNRWVHVAGGGSGAVAAVRTLWQHGFRVSVGPVPEGDVVADLARQLELELVTTPAFETPAGERLTRAIDRAKQADVLVVTEGPGGEYVANAVETTPRVDSALGSAGTAVARGDGGVEEAIQTADELISRVSEVVEQDESVRTR